MTQAITMDAYIRLYEKSPAAHLFFDRDGIIKGVNESAVRLLEQDAEQLVGYSIVELGCGDESRATLKLLWDKCLTGTPVQDAEIKITTGAGGRWVAVSLHEITDDKGRVIGASSTLLDTDNRKRAYLETERFRNAMNHVDEAIMISDADSGRFLDVNQTACRMLGYSCDELLEMTINDIQVGYDIEARRHWMEQNPDRNAEGDLFVTEGRYRRKDKSIVPVEVSSNFQQIGEEAVLVTIARDLTEKKALEKERRELELRIQSAQKLESLGVLAGGIAHDFNNLLVGVLGNANLLLEKMDADSPLRKHVIQIEAAAARASELTNQMLVYSGKARFKLGPVDINALVREMTGLLEAAIGKRSRFSFHPGEHLPLVVGDREQLKQVILNLVTNAAEAQHSDAGMVTLRTGVTNADRAYLLTTHLTGELGNGPFVYIEVIDTGAGMDGETLSKVFEPFYTTKFSGRGLGLPATLGIVRGHHGAIKIESDPGIGTTVSVLIPVADDQAQLSLLDQLTEPQAPAKREANMILVIDDDEAVRIVTEEALTRRGFEVVAIADGETGVSTYRETHSVLAAVLLDRTMPDFDGARVFQALREIDPAVPVIMMSGHPEEDAVGQMSTQGLAGFLHKPFRVTELIDTLRAVIER